MYFIFHIYVPTPFQVDASDTKPLKCSYYTNNNHPLLVLSPAKLEELNLEIGLSFIHELMTEGEISLLQSLASGKVNLRILSKVKKNSIICTVIHRLTGKAESVFFGILGCVDIRNDAEYFGSNRLEHLYWANVRKYAPSCVRHWRFYGTVKRLTDCSVDIFHQSAE